jgi:hypothetical protein
MFACRTLFCARTSNTLFVFYSPTPVTPHLHTGPIAALPFRIVPFFEKIREKKMTLLGVSDRCLPYSVKTGRIELFTDRRYFWKSPRLGGVRRGPVTLTGVSVSSATTSRSFSAEKPFGTSDHGRSMGVSAD